MFTNRKIKKLFDQYTSSEAKGERAKIQAKLLDFGNDVVKPTIEFLQNKKVPTALAELLLRKNCDEKNLKMMISLLGDPNDEARRVACQVIEAKWPASASPLLIEMLADPDIYARNNALKLLSLFRDSSCEQELIGLYNRGSTDQKKSILKILSNFRGHASKKLIISALYDEAWQVRLVAVKCLCKMKDPSSVEPLIKRLKETDHQVKMVAIDALAEIGDKRAIAPFLELLEDNDLLIRQKAIEGLIDIGDASIVPHLIGLLRSHDVNVRRSGVEVLRSMKDPATTAALMQAIKDSDWWVRQIATDSLSALKGGNIVDGFIGLLSDENEDIRRSAIEFFNNVPTPAAFEALIGRLADADWWVRERAMSALGKLKDKRAIQPILKMVNDPQVFRSVPQTLAAIGGQEVVEPLRGFLFNPANQIKIGAMHGLAVIKAQEAVDDLKSCLSSPDLDIKNEAVDALKAITGQVFTEADVAAAGSVQLAPRKASGTTVVEAIVVIDLCNSTDIISRYGNEFALDMLRNLSAIVNPISQQASCLFSKGTGDGFLMTFPDSEKAVLFSLKALFEVGKYNSTVEDKLKIHLRFAINFGESKVDDTGDRIGAAISMTFRVEGVKPEQIIAIDGGMAPEELPLANRVVITENIQKEICQMAKVQTRLIGLFELKGIPGLHRLYHLTIAN